MSNKSDTPRSMTLDLHQLNENINALRAEFEKHLEIEGIHQAAREERSKETNLKVNEMYTMLKNGKQSWSTLIFAGALLVTLFTAVTWAISFFHTLKDVLGKQP